MLHPVRFSFGKMLFSLSMCCCMALGAVAQNIPKPIDSGKIIKEAKARYDKQKYFEAIAFYLQVHENDTNYAVAQSELALTYHSQKQYEKALQAANISLQHNPQSLLQPLINKANALTELGRRSEAMEVYDEVLKIYPFGKLLHYNKAILYEKEGKLKEAMKELQLELQTNFRHASSHLMLAKLATKQEQTTHATLSFIAYLLIEPTSERSRENLEYLDHLLNRRLAATKETFVKPFVHNMAFSDMDIKLNSRLPLDLPDKVKIGTHTTLIKKIQFLLEKAEYAPNTNDFWMEHYIPIMVSLQKQDMFAPVIHTMLASTEHTDIDNWFRRNKPKMDKFWPVAREEFIKAQESISVVEGKPVNMRAWNSEEGVLQAIGNMDKKDPKIRTGHWFFFNEDGSMNSQGKFDKNIKTGQWQYYSQQGRLQRHELFTDKGELDGSYREYYPNGNLSVAAKYKEGKVDGSISLYYDCGALKEAYSFEATNARNGSGKKYYVTGEMEMEYIYLDRKYEGKLKAYYINGKPKYVTTYQAGIKEGEHIAYYDNGALQVKGQYSNDEPSGEWIYYHPNGKMKEKGSLTLGKKTGIWKEYHENGVLAKDLEYNNKSELNNTVSLFDDDGKIYGELLYQNDLLKKAVFYNKNGKIINKASAKGSKLNLKAYTPKGKLSYTQRFVNGKPDGEAKFYHINGLLKAVQYYKEGKQHGLSQEYYPDGKLKSEVLYKEGGAEGYYKEFYRNGTLLQEGWMTKNQREGEWRSYHTNGKPESTTFYVNGVLHGLHKEYTTTGALAFTKRYDMGQLQQITQLDSNGKVVSTVDFTKPETTYKFVYPNGKMQVQASMACGKINNKLEWKDINGKLVSAMQYNKGRKEGIYQTFYADGKTSSKATYQNDVLSGLYEHFYEDGKTSRKDFYKNGQKDSLWTHYHENGKLKAELEYKKDKLLTARYYDTQGLLMIEKSFDDFGLVSYRYELPDGKLSEPHKLENYNGKIMSYYRNGKPAVEETYRNGKQEGKSTYYFSDGKPYLIQEFEFGDHHGIYEEYWDNGQLKLREQYVLGKKEGVAQVYHPDGSTAKTTTYVAGKKHGQAQYFNKSGKLTQTKIYWNDNEYSSKEEKGV